MTDWLNLNPAQLGRPQIQHRMVQGVEINVLMSPYEIPAAVRGYVDSARGRFVIEFRYIEDQEPWTLANEDQPVMLRVGRNSSRLVGIEIDVEKLKPRAVNLNILVRQVEQAIDTLAHRGSSESRQSNYAVAKEVITEQGHHLFESLVGA